MTNADFEQPTIRNEISADVFGMHTESPDNTLALKKAIAYCKENHIDRLTISPGIYYFEITHSIELNDIENFEIYAPNARFIFFSPITPKESIIFFKIQKVHTVKLTGFSIDWDCKKAPLASLVQVKQRTDTYVDFSYMQEGEIPDSAVFITTNAVNSETYTPGVEGGREYNQNGNTAETFIKRERIDDKTYRCYQDIGSLNTLFFNPGTYHLIRHYMYNGGAFYLNDCTHVTFDQITIFGVPGFGAVIGGHSSYIYFYKFKITLPDFETADGIHISQSNGHFLFEDCDLGYQGDDCINIHDSVATGIQKTGSNAFTLRHGNLCVQNGDLLEFRNPDLSPSGFRSQVQNLRSDGKNTEIILQDALPDCISETCVVYNRAFHSSPYEIRNCYFHETRARGVLAQADNGLIENCTFYRIQGAAIQIESGASPAWSEGTGVDNLIIRNNKMIECDINDWDKGVLYMSTFLPTGIPIRNTKYENPTTTVGDSGADYRTAYPMFTNITIENNLFKEYPRRAMILTSFDDVHLKNNRFENDVTRKVNNPERGSIWAAYGKNLEEENNIFKPSPYMKMPYIEKDL